MTDPLLLDAAPDEGDGGGDVVGLASGDSGGPLSTPALGGIIGGGAAAVVLGVALAALLYRRRRAAHRRKLKPARGPQASWKPNRTGSPIAHSLTTEAGRRLSSASLAASPRGQAPSYGRPVSVGYGNTINSISPFFVQQQQRRQQPASSPVLAAGVAASSIVSAGMDASTGPAGRALNARQLQLLAHMQGPARADLWAEKAGDDSAKTRQLQSTEVSRLKQAREKREFTPQKPALAADGSSLRNGSIVIRGRGAGADTKSITISRGPAHSGVLSATSRRDSTIR